MAGKKIVWKFEDGKKSPCAALKMLSVERRCLLVPFYTPFGTVQREKAVGGRWHLLFRPHRAPCAPSVIVGREDCVGLDDGGRSDPKDRCQENSVPWRVVLGEAPGDTDGAGDSARFPTK